MLSLSTLIVFCTFLHITRGQRCPPNEERVLCVDVCNTCESCTNNPPLCFPGCDCKASYTRNMDGICIPCELCEGTPKNCRCITEYQCDSTCKNEGYASGRCEGIFNLSCVCSNLSGLPMETFFDHAKTKKECPDEGKCLASCRSRGFAKGTCTGRRNRKCECSVPFPQDDTSVISPEKFDKVCGCPNAKECTENCKRRGHKGGVCQGDDCYCFRSNRSFDVGIANKGGCPDEAKCLASCRTHGSLKGTCTSRRNRKCKCSVPFPQDDTSIVPPEELDQICGCKSEDECTEKCRRRGFKGGVCQGDICNCYPSTHSDDVDTATSDGCPDDVAKCLASCRSRGFAKGTCTGRKKRRCDCSVPFPDDDFLAVPKQEVLQSCGCPNFKECSENCRRRGYKGGQCKGAFCRCFQLLDAVNVGTAVEGICPDESSCYRFCLRQGFKNGFCDGFKCFCLKASPACFYFQDSGEENCESGPCHRRCKENGYRYGLCMDSDNVCGCFRKID